MRIEYHVKVTHHDWEVAECHKLIPSVYAGIKIQKAVAGNQQVVGYSKFIAVRSGKHFMSTANIHAQDFKFAGKVLYIHYKRMDQFDNGWIASSCKIQSGNLVEAPDLSELQWYTDHVKVNQYLLHIVKCKNGKFSSPAKEVDYSKY